MNFDLITQAPYPLLITIMLELPFFLY